MPVRRIDAAPTGHQQAIWLRRVGWRRANRTVTAMHAFFAEELATELIDVQSRLELDEALQKAARKLGFDHLLDTPELLRIVQAAEMIAARGTTTTPMLAFDYYLMERAKKAAHAGTLCIEVLLRFAEDETTNNEADE